MDQQQAFWEIKTTLEKKGFQYLDSGPHRFEGPMAVGHEIARIQLTIPDLSFIELPKVEILDRHSLTPTLIAHLEQGTGLCYADRTLLRLDQFNPGGSILRILEEAEKTINKSLAGKASDEMALEYPSYWKGQTVQILIDTSSFIGRAHLALQDNLSSKLMLLVGADQKLPMGFKKVDNVTVVSTTSNLHPLDNMKVPKTLAELEMWHNYQDIECSNSFEVVLSSLANKEVVFYSAPNGWVGCRLKLSADLKLLSSKKNLQPNFMQSQVLKRKNEISLIPYHGKEASLDHITTRNLQSKFVNLKGKRIALIGCGTIGSHLGRFLVQSGAGNSAKFFVIDNQDLNAGNLGRHLLNFRDVGKQKAEALAEELMRFHHELDIVPLPFDVKDVLPRISACDLIIDATGVEIVSDFLNWKAIEARKKQHPFNLLHIFMFGNGIAAQSFLNVGEEFACYRCLRPQLNRPWRFDAKKDVNNIGDVAPASCGDGPYVPYAVDAPVMAASLALRATLDYFAGPTPGYRLRQITIDADQANNKKNTTSPKPSRDCPVCQNTL